MSASSIADRHFRAAMAEAAAASEDGDAVARQLLANVVAKYLETRAPDDVRRELLFVADNCDPGADFEFMRP
jgi:predicted RNA-binding Zn ribbon-like protein